MHVFTASVAAASTARVLCTKDQTRRNCRLSRTLHGHAQLAVRACVPWCRCVPAAAAGGGGALPCAAQAQTRAAAAAAAAADQEGGPGRRRHCATPGAGVYGHEYVCDLTQHAPLTNPGGERGTLWHATHVCPSSPCIGCVLAYGLARGLQGWAAGSAPVALPWIGIHGRGWGVDIWRAFCTARDSVR